MQRRSMSLMLLSWYCTLITSPVWAAGAGTGLPYERPLDVLKNSITGPVALAVTVIAIVMLGFLLMFAMQHSWMALTAGRVIGGSLVFGFAAVLTTFGWTAATF